MKLCCSGPFTLMAVGLIFATSPQASAGLISTTGSVVIIPPPADARLLNNPDPNVFQVFLESSGIVLGSSLLVDAIKPGTYPDGIGVAATISSGTRVDSYFVMCDSGGVSATCAGSFTFDAPVLGVIFTDANLASSDPVLGHPGTKYDGLLAARGQESGDSTTISADSRTVSLSDGVSVPGDDIRIITGLSPAGVPEPGAVSLTGIGLLAVIFLRFRRRTCGLAR